MLRIICHVKWPVAKTGFIRGLKRKFVAIIETYSES